MINVELISYLFSIYFFFTLLLFSGFSKIASPQKLTLGVPPKLKILLDITNHHFFSVGEVLLGAILVFYSSAVTESLMAIFILIMVFLGTIIHLRFPDTPCNCFGSLSPMNKVTRLIIVVSSIISCTVIIMTDHAVIERFSIFEFFLLVLCVLFITLSVIKKLLLNKSRLKKGCNTANGNNEQLEYFKPRTFLGFQEDKEVFMSDFSEVNKPMFIVGVDPSCSYCKDLTPDIVNFARGFGTQFPILIITSDVNYVKKDDDVKLQVIVDPKNQFRKTQQIKSLPYAYLLFDKKLKVMSPPSTGDQAIRLLFSTLLNARIVG